MKLAILSCGPNSYSTRRLKEAAKERNYDVKVLNTLKFAIDLQQGQPDLYFRQKLLSSYDAVLPRIGASITYYGTAVVRQFEEMDVFCANTANGITNSRDKLRSLQILSRHHLGIPRTTFVNDKKDVLPAIERVGGAPVVIKLIEGTQGIGVLLAETLKAAEAIIELLQSQKQNVLIQKFVAESKGKDIRAFVVGDRVVAAMRRVAQGQEFRSNVHRGGIAEPVELAEEYMETAVRLRKFSDCVSPVSTCWKAQTARRSWKSIHPRVSRVSKNVPGSTLPGPSSSTLRRAWIFRILIFDSALRLAKDTVSVKSTFARVRSSTARQLQVRVCATKTSTY